MGVSCATSPTLEVAVSNFVAQSQCFPNLAVLCTAESVFEYELNLTGPAEVKRFLQLFYSYSAVMVLLNLERNIVRFSARFFRSCHINHAVNATSENTPPPTVVQESKACKTRLLKVALLGRPNAGKSTIINRLMARAVCPTSLKVHTTKHNAKAVFTEGNAQVVFIDTPGVLSDQELKRYNSPGNNMIVRCALKEADLIGLVQDMSDTFNRNRIQNYILDLTKKIPPETTVILIFNKVDTLQKKSILLELTKNFKSNSDIPKLDDVFMVSALNGSGIDDLKNYMLEIAPPGEWQYSVDEYTDQKPIDIIEETVRAKLMDALPNEVPYKLKVRLADIETRPDGSIKCLIDILCPTDRIARLMLKLKGKRIKTLSQLIEGDLRHAFQNAVSVLLNVKSTQVKKS